MSILIKGMKMPRKGFVDIRIFYDCEAVKIDDPYKKDYVVIEVPGPHGRLIDADEIIKEQNYTAKDTSVHEMRVACRYCAEVLKDAPTIIEAEGQEHE